MATEKKQSSPAVKKAAPPAKGAGKKSCTVAGCKRSYRAKGYCFFHYKKWRRKELPHARYKICSTAECRKPAVSHGLCETHAAARARKAEVKAAPAAAPAPAA